MTALRVEADENATQVEELKKKVKELEQKTLDGDHEIKSLSTKNAVLEKEVEKLEAGIKEAKDLAGDAQHQGTQNETLQRKLQMLEEQAEESDKTLRDTNDKYVWRSSGL